MIDEMAVTHCVLCICNEVQEQGCLTALCDGNLVPEAFWVQVFISVMVLSFAIAMVSTLAA